MNTRAMPGSEGRERSRLLKASRPPAEAPMATIGKVELELLSEDVDRWVRFLMLVFFLDALGMKALRSSRISESGYILAHKAGNRRHAPVTRKKVGCEVA